MKKIGGNIPAIVQVKETKRNDLGETIATFKDLKAIKGYLDYISGGKLYITDGEFLNSLQLGNFVFEPRNNGNLSFKKIK